MVDSTKTHGAVAAAPTPTVEIVKQPGGRPDQKHHNGEMDRLKSEIDQTHAKIAQIRAALSGESLADSPSGKRRSALKDELTALRNQQAGRKGTRGKVFDELKQVQDDIAHRSRHCNRPSRRLHSSLCRSWTLRWRRLKRKSSPAL